MRVLTLDQSLSSTGWALWDEGDDKPVSGAWPLCDGIKHRAAGFVQLHRNLAAIHAECPINLLAYEQPIKTPADKVEKLIALYGIAAHIESYCKIKGIPFLIIGQRKWRASFIGKDCHGLGTERIKRLSIERARQFGLDPITHDEAEAIGILDHVLHLHKIMPPWRVKNPFIMPLS